MQETIRRSIAFAKRFHTAKYVIIHTDRRHYQSFALNCLAYLPALWLGLDDWM